MAHPHLSAGYIALLTAATTPQDVERLTQQIMPILSGKGPALQAAVLADLVAGWVAGHVIDGDPAETKHFREGALDQIINLVRQLIPVNAKILGVP